MAANLALVANFVDITKPTLSIVSPTLNQQWSNATFTASGKAGDNVAVATVYYSLNGGLWTNATTANNWTNWSASLQLTPGTNSLQAYALDASGNASATNAVSFEYVVPMPLSVQVRGLGVSNPNWGHLSGGYSTTLTWLPGYGYYTTSVSLPGYTNGTLLDVNENYTLTAIANPGFAFTNWSDGNGNLLPTAPLSVSPWPPTSRWSPISWTSPSPRCPSFPRRSTSSGATPPSPPPARLPTMLPCPPSIIPSTAASGPNATTANNWTNWSASLQLTPGTNSLRAYALDASGNASATNAVSFEYVVPMPLSVQVRGLGVSNPNWGHLSGGYSTTLTGSRATAITPPRSRSRATPMARFWTSTKTTP